MRVREAQAVIEKRFWKDFQNRDIKRLIHERRLFLEPLASCSDGGEAYDTETFFGNFHYHGCGIGLG